MVRNTVSSPASAPRLTRRTYRPGAAPAPSASRPSQVKRRCDPLAAWGKSRYLASGQIEDFHLRLAALDFEGDESHLQPVVDAIAVGGYGRRGQLQIADEAGCCWSARGA